MIAQVWIGDLLVLGQNAAVGAGPAPAADPMKVQSVWDFVVKGGPVMIPIGLCSLVAMTIIIERLTSLRRHNIIPGDFFAHLKGLLKDGGVNKGEALAYCQSNGSPLANILAAGIKRLSEPLERLEKHIQEAGEREVVKLRKYLRLLSVLGSIAPLLGLLGTITGMITAFQTVAASAEALGRTELLAKGIYEAMITTAAGLMVAIPVVLSYHGLSARIDHLVAEMDQMTVEFMEAYAQPKTVPVEAVPRPSMVAAEQDGIKTGDGRLAASAVVVGAV